MSVAQERVALTTAGLLARYQLAAFFALAYALISASFAIYLANPELPFMPFWLVGVASPTISALLVSYAIGGTAEVRRLLSGFLRWRIGWRWYLAAMLLPLGSLVVAFIYVGLGNQVDGPVAGITGGFLLGQLLFTLFSGPLSEEAGWRGFALPRLQQRYSALRASLALGVMWAFWHVPIYFLPETAAIPFPVFVPLTIGLAIIFSWIYNNTGGSLLATVLAHFGFNFSGAFIAGHLGLLPPMVLNIAGSGLAVVLVLAIIVFAGPARFSRRPAEQPLY